MIKKTLKIIVLAHILVGAFTAHAEVRNDVPSCYAANNIQAPEGVYKRDLVVVIDGTFDPDNSLKGMVFNKINRYVSPGDRISILSFTSYIGDAYTKLHFTGLAEADMSVEERHNTSKKVLRSFDACLQGQMNFVQQNIGKALQSSFKLAGQEVPKTEIIGNLYRILPPLLQRETESAPVRTVLLVSDMLENSDITTFYSKGKVVPVKVQAELAKVQNGHFYSDWSAANVYVMGAGWVRQSKRGFRGTDVMQSIESFWRQYMEMSNANLVAFGQPELMQELR